MRPIPARPTPDSSREVLVTRSHKPRWRRARGLAALAIPLALAAGVLPASGTAAAEPTAPTPATAARSTTRNVLPFPGSLSTSISPPSSPAISRLMDNPSPVPPNWRR